MYILYVDYIFHSYSQELSQDSTMLPTASLCLLFLICLVLIIDDATHGFF